MKIGLIDCDSKNFPNIPLMKISAWHKNNGDDVIWYDIFSGHCDIVYVAKVFSFSADYELPIDADFVYRGGSGYAIKVIDGIEYYDSTADINLPYEIEHVYPDYSLYGIKDTAYGFLTRGCPRGCAFCHVKDKEGLKSIKVADLNEFWKGQKKIVLCDPNIFACKDWECLLQQLIDSNAYVDFNQGLDIRLMTEEKANKLSLIKMKEIHFAWDRYEDKDIILPKLELYSKFANKKKSHNAIVYTIVNFDTNLEQDLERIYILRQLGYWAYIMIYDKQHCKKIYKHLQRWVNNRFIFSKVKTFDEYLSINGK